ncbi:MAG: terminase [Bacteroides sp.]|nr:terminase [Bacteroides sp.]MCP4141296.1 terminase [Chloroflexota bacterium]
MNIQTSCIYKANLESTCRVNVNQGGTSSGKTYSLIQLLFTLAVADPMQVITVVGQDVPNLKKGAYRDAKTILARDEFLWSFFNVNETDRVMTGQNGSVIEFTSYKDAQDAKSGKRDYLFVNEANGISYEVYWQLAMRTRKKIFIDYNPNARFWAHENLIGREGVKLIISDHRHNPFLSKEEHDKIEGIEDEELWKVYARGKTGQIMGLIYRNWDIVDKMPDTYKQRWCGLDFGFTNDPTSLIDVRLSGGELYLDELVYSTGMLNNDIYEAYKSLCNGILVIADSAEPKSIAELRNLGMRIEPAIKGRDSIKNGIDILKRYKIHVTRRSINLRKELLSYKWKVDRDGSTTNKPIDSYNHGLDSCRYVALNQLLIKRQAKRPKSKLGTI